MSTYNPLISVIIPVYNGANFIDRAIQSVLNQSYKNIEIIVINDGSNDDGETEASILNYKDRVRYIKKENGGVASALNLGISKMSGDYFSWLSHDDEYDDGYLEAVVKELNNVDPNTVIASGWQLIDDKGRRFYKVDPVREFTQAQLSCGILMLMRFRINGCGLVIPRSCFDEVGIFNEDLPTTQDFDFFFRLFKKASLHYITKLGVLSRCHPEQGSKTMLDEHVREADKLWIWMLKNVVPEDIRPSGENFFDFLKETYLFLEKNTGYKASKKFAKLFYLKNLLQLGKYEKFHSECFSLLGWSIKDNLDLSLFTNKSKPRVLLYLKQNVPTSGLNRMVLLLKRALSETYSTYVTYCESERTSLVSQPSILFLPWSPLSQNGEENLVYFAYLLGFDLIINPFNCVKQPLTIYEQAKIFSIKTIAWNHEHYFMPLISPILFNSVIERNSKLREANKVVWLNKKSLNVYSVQENNGVEIPNGLTLTKGGYFKENKNLLLAVGRFNDYVKRLDLILLMFSMLIKVNEKAKLLLVGPYDLEMPVRPGKKETFSQLLKRLRIPEDRISFVGEVEKPDEYYKKSSLLIHCSENEAFGLVILEAAYHFVPTIMFDKGGSEELIENGVDGLVYPFEKVEMMAMGVNALLNDVDRLQRMQKDCARITERFSYENFSKNWLRVVNEILEDKQSFTPHLEAISLSEVKEMIFNYEMALKNVFLQGSEEKLKVLQIENENLQRGLSKLLNSNSWRVTKPLRKLRNLIRKL